MRETGPTIANIKADLASEKCNSVDLVHDALRRIDDSDNYEFIRVYHKSASAAAHAHDILRGEGLNAGPLAGIPVSVKDLFDFAGETTTAGSVVLRDTPPAQRDALIVTRLRAAGAVIVGTTNMVEFAYGGVGTNPHYGTPGNPVDKTLVPGGSSSGAAVAVGNGMSVVSIGTDTGGSVRIPAALCGLVGFKPTQRRVPRDGCLPLSDTLDSIGPIGRSVACCAVTDAVMAGEQPSAPLVRSLGGLRFAVLRTLMMDSLDETVATAFDRACRKLRDCGARIEEIGIPQVSDAPLLNAGFNPVEGYTVHAYHLGTQLDKFDPRVGQRLLAGSKMSAVQYIDLLRRRQALIERVTAVALDYDALVMPTIPITAPPIADVETDDSYFRNNSRIVRNTSLANQIDGCAITLPIQKDDELPVGLQMVGLHGTDHRLLMLAASVESALGG